MCKTTASSIALNIGGTVFKLGLLSTARLHMDAIPAERLQKIVSVGSGELYLNVQAKEPLGVSMDSFAHSRISIDLIGKGIIVERYSVFSLSWIQKFIYG